MTAIKNVITNYKFEVLRKVSFKNLDLNADLLFSHQSIKKFSKQRQPINFCIVIQNTDLENLFQISTRLNSLQNPCLLLVTTHVVVVNG